MTMQRYEVHGPDDAPIMGLVTDRDVAVVLDRATGALTLGEVDARGRLLPKGLRETVGYDPLAATPALVKVASTGRVTRHGAVKVRGKSSPSEVLLPPEGDE